MHHPLGSHTLTEADMAAVVHNAVGGLRGRHTKSVARHAELDVGETIFASIVKIAEDYAAYRLGFKGKTANDVGAAHGELRKLLDANFANFLAHEAMDAIDGEIGKKIGQAHHAHAM